MLMSTHTQWQTVMKPAFLNTVLKLPAKEIHQVMEKITMLSNDPRPDGKVKKQLTHLPGRPYRIRSGKYRIFYTYNQQLISIYKLDERSDDTYSDTSAPDTPLPPDALLNLDVPADDLSEERVSTQQDWERTFGESTCRKLPKPITVQLLYELKVPASYHKRLRQVKDEDELLSCPGVAEEFLVQIHDYMFERPLIQVMQEPDLVLNDVDDLLRFRDGELLNFLLKLSPEQEKYATWSLNVNGPTLVKGNPGTGKSTVALYRIRSLLTQLLQAGQTPRLLFTTYTNALVKSSRQLLQQLLGDDVAYVQVETADTIANMILHERGQAQTFAIISPEELHKITATAIDDAQFTGTQFQQFAQKHTFQRMSPDYLEQELTSIIAARQITTLDAYLKTPRTGRKMSLNTTQRTAIWQVYERWRQLLQDQGKETWQQFRVRASVMAASSSLACSFDAVIIEEAQDLDPGALRMLVALCKTPNRLFITADANQSIYGSTFSWSAVHKSLRFQGRTNVLRANYRSTAEIGEAARSYLKQGALEVEEDEPRYVNNGPLPDARIVRSSKHEVQLLISYFKKANRSLRHTISSCAVLCPDESAGRSLQAALRKQGLEATFMTGRDLDLMQPGIKIMTLKSSKGLEFPIVALAGFTPNYPSIPNGATTEELNEFLARERRTLFVGMTRAMRALLVIIPDGATNPLLSNFDPELWNFSRPI